MQLPYPVLQVFSLDGMLTLTTPGNESVIRQITYTIEQPYPKRFKLSTPDIVGFNGQVDLTSEGEFEGIYSFV